MQLQDGMMTLGFAIPKGRKKLGWPMHLKEQL